MVTTPTQVELWDLQGEFEAAASRLAKGLAAAIADEIDAACPGAASAELRFTTDDLIEFVSAAVLVGVGARHVSLAAEDHPRLAELVGQLLDVDVQAAFTFELAESRPDPERIARRAELLELLAAEVDARWGPGSRTAAAGPS